MTIFYKATRPDGTDFHTGTVDYAGALESGKPLKRKPQMDLYVCCSSGVYHASDAAAETLIGGHWPCRLFEVAGRPVAQEGHKFGFRSIRVVREIDAWQALGPNGQAVARLIEQAKQLTPQQAEQLHAAWDATRDAAWDAAWDVAGPAAGAAARDAARDVAGNAAWNAAAWDGEVAIGDTSLYAASAAGDAASVLVVRDLINERHFNTLYSPWASIMEEGEG